jgi:hypothetical protein
MVCCFRHTTYNILLTTVISCPWQIKYRSAQRGSGSFLAGFILPMDQLFQESQFLLQLALAVLDHEGVHEYNCPNNGVTGEEKDHVDPTLL